jgi:mono/diheme cytochrome c family protein
MSQKQKKKHLAPGPAGTPVSIGNPAAAVPRAAVSAPAPALQEELEPQVDSTPMPAWLFILMIVLAYWGMLHLDRYGGGFNELVYGPYQSYAQLADLQPKSDTEQLIATGRSIYDQVCVTCHQSTGLGNAGQAPPLAGSDWVLGPPNRLIRIPLHGLIGPIKVKDQTWNLQMPPFGGLTLLEDDKNLAALLSYIRQNWGNKAPVITPAQVKAVRAETSSRTAQWTADELLKLPETP